MGTDLSESLNSRMKVCCVYGWMDGWMDGEKERKAVDGYRPPLNNINASRYSFYTFFFSFKKQSGITKTISSRRHPGTQDNKKKSGEEFFFPNYYYLLRTLHYRVYR